MVSAAGAKSTVLGCVLGAGAIASVDSLSRGEWPPLRVGVGVFLAGGMLLVLADVNAPLAAGFAGLVLVGALLRDGIPAARRVQTVLGN